MAGTPILGLISILFIAGACTMTFFVILGGTTYSVPLRDVHFLWAATGNIPNAPPVAQWTLWGYCTRGPGGHNTNCIPHHAAYPFVPQDNFNTDVNIPENFLRHRDTFYYLSRFAFAFYLISIFFMVCSFFTGLLAVCSRLGSAIAAMVSSIALFFITLTAALMTSWTVLGRGKFRGNGQSSQIGTYAYAFTWTSVALMMLATVMFCVGFAGGRKEKRDRSAEMTSTNRGKMPFFRRRGSPAGESEQRFT